MGMTITEKILLAHTAMDYVQAGDLIEARVDMALANDITAPLSIEVFNEIGKSEVHHKEKIALVQDHFVPNKDISSAQQAKIMREFAQKQGIKNYFDVGEAGIEHVILPEKGIVIPGDLVIGADSHTCTYGAIGAFATGVGSTDLGVAMATGKVWLKVPATMRVIFMGELLPWVSGKDLILYLLGELGVEGANYRALEFSGNVIQGLSMDQRFTIANMAIEAGAKNAIIGADETTRAYVEGKSSRVPLFIKSDTDAEYEREITINVEQISPQVAFPNSPDNVRPVSEASHIKLDQVFIGSCTNGRIEDLRQSASILEQREVAQGVRLIVIPGSPSIYLQAIREGIIESFINAGAVIGPPTCGPCLGGHMGVLAEGERCLSTSNRNFIGRMGHPKSEVYLANPAVAAASAVLGRIGSPDEIESL
ncbi:MAG: 3-isopropylmalate dehydratase large subunit [Thermodesulfobacteriota bacterium]|nr:3-isopropylmalate dehydratase large subunit [Thermodesulfobacteriota bacterium]